MFLRDNLIIISNRLDRIKFFLNHPFLLLLELGTAIGLKKSASDFGGRKDLYASNVRVYVTHTCTPLLFFCICCLASVSSRALV